MKDLVCWEFSLVTKYTYTVNNIKNLEPCILSLSRKALFFSFVLWTTFSCKNQNKVIIAPGVGIKYPESIHVINDQDHRTLFLESLCIDSTCHYYLKSLILNIDTIHCSSMSCNDINKKITALEQKKINIGNTLAVAYGFQKNGVHIVRYSIPLTLTSEMLILDRIFSDSVSASSYFLSDKIVEYVVLD